VTIVASILHVYAGSDEKLALGVGGILPVADHAVVGETDSVIKNSQSATKFCD
jgi:hypothetical protein